MHYPITRGAGFIGSHLAEPLLGRGEDVIVVDDLSTGSIAIQPTGQSSRIARDHWFYSREAAARGAQDIETNVHGTELVLELVGKKRKRVHT